MTKYLLLMIFAFAFASWARAASVPVVNYIPLAEPCPLSLSPDSLPVLPPLSGITLLPNRATGTYTLEFSQELEEPAIVKVTNAKKKVVYTSNLSPQAYAAVKQLNMGKLTNGSYLVEVKTANTTYWKKLEVSNQGVKSATGGKTTKGKKGKKSGKSKKGKKSRRR